MKITDRAWIHQVVEEFSGPLAPFRNSGAERNSAHGGIAYLFSQQTERSAGT